MPHNTFYTYCVDKKFIRVKDLKFSLTKSIISYWISKGDAKEWSRAIKKKYPNATLEEAVLILKSDSDTKPF